MDTTLVLRIVPSMGLLALDFVMNILFPLVSKMALPSLFTRNCSPELAFEWILALDTNSLMTRPKSPDSPILRRIERGTEEEEEEE